MRYGRRPNPILKQANASRSTCKSITMLSRRLVWQKQRDTREGMPNAEDLVSHSLNLFQSSLQLLLPSPVWTTQIRAGKLSSRMRSIQGNPRNHLPSQHRKSSNRRHSKASLHLNLRTRRWCLPHLSPNSQARQQ